MAEEAARLPAEPLDRQRDEADRDLLAGRRHDVLLALVRALAGLARELEQPVGLAGHRGDHHHHVVPRPLRREGAAGDVPDAVDVAHRGAAVFLDDERHAGRPPVRTVSRPARRTASEGRRRRCQTEPAMERVLLDGDTLRWRRCSPVARGRARAELAPEARERVRRARALVEARLADGEAHYGINTGFGTLAEVRIDKPTSRGCSGTSSSRTPPASGAPLPVPEARALMLLRANVLAKGFSGIRRGDARPPRSRCSTAASSPVVPERGSVGASGDLAPLAHLALVLIGEGEALLAPSGRGAGGGGGHPPARGRGAPPRRPRPGGPRSQGGARPGQRHPGDVRGGRARRCSRPSGWRSSPTSPAP